MSNLINENNTLNDYGNNQNDFNNLILCKAVFKNSFGSWGPLDITFTETPTPALNQSIASVTIDTSRFRNPSILIEFIGTINVSTTVAATSTLTFNLYRTCNGNRFQQLLTSYTNFVTEPTGGVTSSHTLYLPYASCDDDCQDCCTYTLMLGGINNVDIGTLTYSINGLLKAQVTES